MAGKQASRDTGTTADPLTDEARELYRAHAESIFRRTDRMFVVLLLCQWLAGIAAACRISPRAWAGLSSQVHPHVWGAILLGGAIIFYPILLGIIHPGRTFTRHVIAVGQMLMSALLIHLTGGRIETHFLRGMYWRQSVYGVLASSSWRAVEHAGWVFFEDFFLIRCCLQSDQEMKEAAVSRTQLEALNAGVERQVTERTAELQQSETRFRVIFNEAPIGIARVDLTGRPFETNSALQELLGYSADEMRERCFNELPPPLL